MDYVTLGNGLCTKLTLPNCKTVLRNECTECSPGFYRILVEGVPTCGNRSQNPDLYQIFHIEDCKTPDVSNDTTSAVCTTCKNNYSWDSTLSKCKVTNCQTNTTDGEGLKCS